MLKNIAMKATLRMKLLNKIVFVLLLSCFMTTQAKAVYQFQYESGWDALPGAAAGLGNGLGNLIRGGIDWAHSRKIKKFIKSCNNKALEALPPEDAMRLIIEKGIKCDGNQKKIKGKKL